MRSRPDCATQWDLISKLKRTYRSLWLPIILMKRERGFRGYDVTDRGLRTVTYRSCLFPDLLIYSVLQGQNNQYHPCPYPKLDLSGPWLWPFQPPWQWAIYSPVYKSPHVGIVFHSSTNYHKIFTSKIMTPTSILVCGSSRFSRALGRGLCHESFTS